MDELELHPRQRSAIAFEGPDLLVSGPPGSGKTIVLLARARRLAQLSNGRRPSAIVFTFNKGLAQYAREQLGLNDMEGLVEVTNFHRWARRQLSHLGRPPALLQDGERAEIVAQVIAAHRTEGGSGSALLQRPARWWIDEIDWIKGSALPDWPAYASAPRAGRGMGLLEVARRVVWDVFMRYQRMLAARHRSDYTDLAPSLLQLWNPMPEHAMVDHVLIDEAQDLHPAELRLLLRLARKTRTVVVDRRQKIYRATFAWKDLGFDVAGGQRSQVVVKCYRSTRQIMALAASLRRRDLLVRPSDPDFGDGELPDREGPVPVVYATTGPAHEDRVILRLVVQHLAQAPMRTIAILARSRRRLEHMADLLAAQRVEADLLLDGNGSVLRPGVKLTTFHTAKGLEFGAVILAGLTEGLFPPNPMREIDALQGEDVTEFLSTERRLLYVAMTRAKHALYLLHGPRPSRFLVELDPTRYVTTASELEG